MQAVFDILAEPNRRAILGLLAERERSVGELQTRLRLPQPSISKHLRVLRENGFVDVRADAQKRLYALRPEPLMKLDGWLEPYRRTWTTSLDKLERYLDRMSTSTKTPAAKPGTTKKSPTKGRKR